ncbi:alpha/beta fold hydrolase [Gluconacetobacter johannae]|uniref:Alpha/beta fold hydrolase n=1 Tax=Gluconacetobacter johannae TaxID=112140 RepID=A0A7W4P5H3_9PROT|nr:alpha/beta fold hydrolase [Gluconacetobacter johannae]MBB2176143.1 alpha/beta fold hydrolase [Gluconacetobacter johannae]
MIRRIAVLSNLRLSRLLYLALLAPLAGGCALRDLPVPRPPPAHAADGALVPPDGSMTLSDGVRVPYRVWPARGTERAVILALHGFDDSRDAWEFPAPVLAGRGMTLYAPDLRGFGGMPDRGGWAGADRLVRDVADEARAIARRHPGVPLYLMGESMGGAVLTCLMAGPDAPPVAGTILLAPAVWKLGPGAEVLLRLMAAGAPGWRLTGHELPVHVVAGDDLAAMRRLYYDPLTLRATRMQALSGLAALMHRAADDAPHMRGPVLVVYGGRDQLIPPSAMADLWRRLPASARRDYIPGGYHLLMRGRTRQAVMNDVTQWIAAPDRFLPSGGDAAAAAWSALPHDGSDTPPPLPAALDGLAAK